MPDAPYDGVDTNVMSLNDFDADGDGEVAAEIDCGGVLATTCDVDGDGIDDFVGGTDCDDIQLWSVQAIWTATVTLPVTVTVMRI